MASIRQVESTQLHCNPVFAVDGGKSSHGRLCMPPIASGVLHHMVRMHVQGYCKCPGQVSGLHIGLCCVLSHICHGVAGVHCWQLLQLLHYREVLSHAAIRTCSKGRQLANAFEAGC